MKNDKKGFVIYHDYAKHVNLLSDEETGKLFKGLLDYAETETLPNLTGATLMAFSFIKEQIDRDTQKWIDRCNKNRENGKLGGRPSKKEGIPSGYLDNLNKPNGFEDNQTELNSYTNKQSKTKKADTEKEKVVETVKETENVTITDNIADIYILEIERYTLNSDLRNALLRFVEMRSKSYGFTLNAFKLLLEELNNLTSDDTQKITIVNKSVMNSWKSFYPITQKQEIKQVWNDNKEEISEEERLQLLKEMEAWNSTVDM